MPRVCAVIAEDTVDKARSAIKNAQPVADLIELRLDFLRDFDFTRVEQLHTLLDNRAVPAIITCRSIEEGGRQRIDTRVRLRLLVEGARRLADYCDIEAAHYNEAAQMAPDQSRLIVSYHNFNETPSDIDAIYDRVCSFPAAVHKIVTQANGVVDTIAIFRLLDRARTDKKNLIALAMGNGGVITRILGPSRGAFLTYGAIGRGRESAPGQPSCQELKGLYRIDQITRSTTVTGLAGKPVSNSASPAMHNMAYQALGLDWLYLPVEVDNVTEFFSRFVRAESREIDWNFRGLSVTIPHKVSVMALLDSLDEVAESVGAVNTVVAAESGLRGYNTDVQGAMKPLVEACSLDGESCGVIGAGGAARAVIHGLVSYGAQVTVFARDPAKSSALARAFGVSISPLDDLASSEARVIINTTPVGMRGHSEGTSPVPRGALRGRRIVYDLVYSPLDTELLSNARAEGCHAIRGIEMLIAQAAAQFQLWTGLEPPVAMMRAAALEKINQSS